MKQTLPALAVAVGVLAALPAWAQSTTAPAVSPMPDASGPIVRPQSSTTKTLGSASQAAPAAMPSAGASAEAAPDEAAPSRHAIRHHRVRHEAARHEPRSRASGRHGSGSGDTMANELNRQEAARLSSGAPASPSAGGMSPATPPGAAPSSR